MVWIRHILTYFKNSYNKLKFKNNFRIMTTFAINIKEETAKKFSQTNLEKFVNSEDFEDLVLGYHMIK